MVRDRQCKGTLADGARCGAPQGLVDPLSGYCRAHDPATEEERLAASRRGGEATRARYSRALQAEDLPTLDSPQAAARWCDIIGRAAATGRLSASAAQAALRSVSECLRAIEAGDTAERLDALQEQVAGLRSGDVRRVK